MFSQSGGILISFAGYLLIMMGIGVYYYKQTSNINDYVLGDRSLNSWVTALSAQASDMSGWLLMGLPGYAFVSGMESIWIAIGLGVGTYINWKVVAMRLRKYTEISGDSITISSFLENRFRDKSNMLRIISAIVILIFFTIYTSAGLVAGGKLFSTVFGVNYIAALTIGTLVIISYTFLGGFLAVCWTDFFQGLLMLLALIIVPFSAVRNIGGVNAAIEGLKGIELNFLDPMLNSSGASIGVVSLISLLAWGLGYFGQPHILSRFMAISSHKEIKKARAIAMVWVVISLFAAVVIGLVGRVLLNGTLGVADSETVFMVMVNSMFTPIIAGVLLAAILAAVMSTADSQLLVTSSALAEDFYSVLINKNATDKELLKVSRIAVVAVAALAYVLALNPNSSVLDLVSYAWAGFGASFGPVIILSLFWKQMTRNGALAGLVMGGVTVVLWKQLSGGIFDLYEIVPAMIVSFIAIYVVSKLGEAPSKEITDEFELVNSTK